MIILGFKPFQRGHLRTQNTTPLMLIFPNEINKLPWLRSGVNVECVFTVIAKWVARRPRILIVDEPTRGIDIGAKAEVHALLARLAQQGFSIIVISSDLPEVLAVSDRVLVIKQGRINGELNRSEAT